MGKFEKQVSVCRVKKGEVLKRLRNRCPFAALKRGRC